MVTQAPALGNRVFEVEMDALRLMNEVINIDVHIAEDASAELRQLYQQFLSDKTKLIEAIRRNQKWSLGQRIVSFIQSIVSIFVGAAACATGVGAAAGAVLIVNGVIGLGHESAKASGAYERLAERLSQGDSEKHDRIIMQIEMSGTFITLGFSVFSAGAVGIGNLGQGIKDAIAASQDAVAAAQAINSMGQGRSNATRMRNDSQCFVLAYEIRMAEQVQTEHRSKTMEVLETQGTMFQTTASGIDSSRRIGQKIWV